MKKFIILALVLLIPANSYAINLKKKSDVKHSTTKENVEYLANPKALSEIRNNCDRLLWRLQREPIYSEQGILDYYFFQRNCIVN